MARLTVTTSTKVTVQADGKVRFSDEFVSNVYATVQDTIAGFDTRISYLGPAPDATDSSHVSFNVTFSTTDTTVLGAFLGKLQTAINSMTAHGRDTDIMNVILAKYPELRTHPRINELVGSFDNMSAKIKELSKDKKSKPTHTTPPLPKGAPVPSKPPSNQDKRQQRDDQLKGHAADQRQALARSAGTDIRSIVTPAQPPIIGVTLPESGA